MKYLLLLFLFFFNFSAYSIEWININSSVIKDSPIYQFQSFNGSVFYTCKELYQISNTNIVKKYKFDFELLNESEFYGLEIIDDKVILSTDTSVAMSDELGNNWQIIYHDFRYIGGLYYLIYANNNIIFGTNFTNSSQFSTDKGYSWSRINEATNKIEYYSFNKHNGFVYQWNREEVYLSTDLGNQWVQLESQIPKKPFTTFYTSIFFHEDGSLYWGYFNTPIFLDSFGIYKSDKYAENVELIYKPSNAFNKYSKIYFKHNLGFICSDSLFAVSEDFGKSWIEYPSPIPLGDRLTSIFYSEDNYFYIGTYHGLVLRSKFEPTTVTDNLRGDNPISIYPNPASDYIVMKLNDVETGLRPVSTASLEINNTIGLLVLNSNLYQQTNLNGIIKIDISNLPSGIYFATVKSGTEIITKQFVIMR
jgi:hypothetical protein